MQNRNLSAAAQRETKAQRETDAAYRLAYRLAEMAQVAVEEGNDPARALLLASQAFAAADEGAAAHLAAFRATEAAAAAVTETLLRDIQKGGE
jgi:hypothetical protein